VPPARAHAGAPNQVAHWHTHPGAGLGLVLLGGGGDGRGVGLGVGAGEGGNEDTFPRLILLHSAHEAFAWNEVTPRLREPAPMLLLRLQQLLHPGKLP